MSAQPILRGELGLIGLFDLGQLLMLNGATGCLAVQREDRKAFLYFTDGRLVNAVDESLVEGENAAYRIFTWRTGSFEFRVEPPTSSVTIDATTDSVMLDAARRMDEAAVGDPGDSEPFIGETPSPNQEQRLLERHAALEGLRDVFHRVAGSAAALAQASRTGGPLTCLMTLGEAEDRLIFQAGQRPALRRRGAWADAHPDVLSPATYQKLREQIEERLDAIDPVATPGPRRFTLEGGTVVALEVVGTGAQEALWIRPIELSPPDASELHGDHDALAAVLSPTPSVVLVGGSDITASRALLHALLAELVESQQTTLLVVTRDPTYHLPGAAGVALRVPPSDLRGALRAVEPGVVALDPAMPSGQVTLEELTLVSQVLAGVVGQDPGTLLARWLARLDGRTPQAAAGSLLATHIGLVLAEAGEAGLGFAAFSYSSEERDMVLRGKTVTPSAAIGRAVGSGSHGGDLAA